MEEDFFGNEQDENWVFQECSSSNQDSATSFTLDALSVALDRNAAEMVHCVLNKSSREQKKSGHGRNPTTSMFEKHQDGIFPSWWALRRTDEMTNKRIRDGYCLGIASCLSSQPSLAEAFPEEVPPSSEIRSTSIPLQTTVCSSPSASSTTGRIDSFVWQSESKEIPFYSRPSQIFTTAGNSSSTAMVNSPLSLSLKNSYIDLDDSSGGPSSPR